MGHRLRLFSAAALALGLVVAFALARPAAAPVDPPVTEAAVALHGAAKAAPGAVGAKLEALAVELEKARDLAAKGKAADGEASVKATLAALTALTARPELAKSPAAEGALRAAAILQRALGVLPVPPPTPPGTSPKPPIVPPTIRVPATTQPGRWIERVVGSTITPPVDLPTGVVDRPRVPALPMGTNLYVTESGYSAVTLINERLGVHVRLHGNPGTDDRFQDPAGVAVDSRGQIYIADTGRNRIVRVNSIAGDCWVAFGRQGSGQYQFNRPQAVAVDSHGHIYVADTGNHRIVRIDDMAGQNWVTFGTRGSGDNQFEEPSGVMIDRRGGIVVADTQNNRIARFSSMTGTGWATCCGPPLTPAATTPPPDTILTPMAIAEDREGRYYVTSSYGRYAPYGAEARHRIVRIDDMTGRGRVGLGSFGAACDAHNDLVALPEPRLFAPAGVAIAPDGHLFAVDALNQRLIEANGIDGAGWHAFGGGTTVGGSCYGSLTYPWGLAAPQRPAKGAPTTCEPVACPPYQKTCDGRCVNIDDPRYGCAPTGCTACALANVGAQSCSATNQCDYNGCLPREAFDLDGNRANGCEVRNEKLIAWFDATQRARVLGDKVSYWADRVFSNDHGGRHAGLIAASAGGYSFEWAFYGAPSGTPAMPSVRFGPTDRGYHSSFALQVETGVATALGPSLAGKPYTILAVVSRSSDRGDNDFLIGIPGGCGVFGCTNGSALLLGWTGNTEACLRQWGDDLCLGGLTGIEWTRNTRTLFIATNDGTTKTLTVKLPRQAPLSTSRTGGSFSTSTGFYIGGTSFRASQDRRFEGNVYELIIYESVIPPAHLALMQGYLEGKYGFR